MVTVFFFLLRGTDLFLKINAVNELATISWWPVMESSEYTRHSVAGGSGHELIASKWPHERIAFVSVLFESIRTWATQTTVLSEIKPKPHPNNRHSPLKRTKDEKRYQLLAAGPRNALGSNSFGCFLYIKIKNFKLLHVIQPYFPKKATPYHHRMSHGSTCSARSYCSETKKKHKLAQ